MTPRSLSLHPSNLPRLLPLLLRIVQSLSILPTELPEPLRMVPSLSMRPTLLPELFRTVPSESILPMEDPVLFRTVPSSNFPIEEPELSRKVPSLSILPIEEPELFRTVIDEQARAGAANRRAMRARIRICDSGRRLRLARYMSAHQDSIELANIELEAIVGILDFERTTPQPVILDLKLFADLDPCGDSGDLALGVDYATVLAQVRAVVEEGRWRLIESMALALCSLFLAKPAEGESRAVVERVDIRIRKPKILGGIAIPGIHVSRSANWCVLQRTELGGDAYADRLVQPSSGGAWRVHVAPSAFWDLPQHCAALVLAGEFDDLSVGSRIPRGGRTLVNIGEGPATALVLGRLHE